MDDRDSEIYMKTPPDIVNAATNATNKLSPQKSRAKYAGAYKMLYIIPSRLGYNDQIVISGYMQASYNFSIKLVTGCFSPDYQNVAFQIEAVNENESFKGGIIRNGGFTEIRNPLEEDFPIPANARLEGPEMMVSFSFYYNNGPNGSVSVGHPSDTDGSVIFDIQYQHDIGDIRYLDISDNVKVNTLLFKFS